LTKEYDEDLQTAKAVEASMQSGNVVFGPSTRIDTIGEYAMVPSNAPPALSQEDQALNQALEASLSSSFIGVSQDIYEDPLDLVARVRKDGWPVAFRTTNGAFCCVPAVMQCVMSIPNVHQRLLRYDVNSPGEEYAHAYARDWQRLGCAYTHSARAYIVVDEMIDSSFMPISNQRSLISLVRDYYAKTTEILEAIPRDISIETDDLPLAVFKGASPEEHGAENQEVALQVDLKRSAGTDLVSILARTFTTSKVCVTQLSQCCVFALVREGMAPMKFPVRLYMDRFMRENMEEANKLWNYQEQLYLEIQKLVTDKDKLTNWRNHDTLQSLRASMHYFENLANDNGDPRRREAHILTKEKLETIIRKIEANVQFLDARTKELTDEAEGLFDRPDLQRYPYDLQAVLMHDGLLGRSHVYTYTKDTAGRWWKIVDHHVSEVTEDVVLNDQSGLHLAAGALLLFYCQADPVDSTRQSPELPQYPRFVKDIVEQDNVLFLSELPPEIASLSQYAPTPATNEMQDMEGVDH